MTYDLRRLKNNKKCLQRIYFVVYYQHDDIPDRRRRYLYSCYHPLELD